MWGLDVRTGEPFTVSPMGMQEQHRVKGLAVGPSPVDMPGARTSKLYAVIGDSGACMVCDVATKQLVRTLRMATPGVAAVFAPDRDTLITADFEANLYEWDLGTGRCKQRCKDPFATKITSLATHRATAFAPSPLLAVGTHSGNIDFFDLSGPAIPSQPSRCVDNLTTNVTSIHFHHQGELVVAGSVMKQDALKLVHAGSGTVFQNWPTAKTPVQRLSAVSFSRRGGLLAMGNERGRVLLYRVKHYETEVR